MVTIYTERTPATETYVEKRPFNFGRLAAITLGSTLLMSLAAAYNLSADVNDFSQKLSYTQQRLNDIQQRLDVTMPAAR